MTNQASLKIQVNNQDMFNQSTIKDDNHQNNPMEKWVEELGQYEKMLEGVTRANLASGYKEELGAVENWFDALEEGERTATMYTLIHKSNPILVRFLITVLQRIAKTQEQSRGLPTFSDYSRPNSATPSLVPTLKHSSSNSDSSSDFSAGTPSDLTSFMMKNKDIGNTSSSQFLSKPSTPSFSSRKFKFGGLNIKTPGSWGQNELKSPLLHPKSAVFPRESAWQTKFKSQPLKSPAFPPGLTHPTVWTPTNVHFPTTPSPATIKSSTPTSSPSAPSPTATPDPVDFDLLADIPRWLRSLRLHKYTHLFTEMTWKEMIILTDQQLADKGVAALGARRKFLKVFDNVQSEARRLGYTAPPLIVTTDSSSDSQLTGSDASGDDQPSTRYRI